MSIKPKELIAAERFEATVRAISTAEDNPALVAGVLLRIAIAVLVDRIGRKAWMVLAAEIWAEMEKKKRGDSGRTEQT